MPRNDMTGNVAAQLALYASECSYFRVGTLKEIPPMENHAGAYYFQITFEGRTYRVSVTAISGKPIPEEEIRFWETGSMKDADNG